MTRRKLQLQRSRTSCAIFFEGLRGDRSSTQLRALPRMKALAERCGYQAAVGRQGARRAHHFRTASMRRFRSRIAFHGDGGVERSFDEMRRAFLARPQFDVHTLAGTGRWEYFDERTGSVTLGPARFVVPFGYIEWRVGGESWLIPVNRTARAHAVAILQTRQRARRDRIISPVALAQRSA